MYVLVTGQHEEAISEHESELFMSEAINDNIGIAVAHRKIGECYGELGQYDKAVHHQKLHLRLAEAENNYVEMQRAFATIGRTYFIQVHSCLESCTIIVQLLIVPLSAV